MGWFRDLGRDRAWLQGCIIAAAGAILSVGTCFGFLFTMNFNTGNSTLGEGFGFLMIAAGILFALAVPVGGIWFIVGLVKNAAAKKAAAGSPGEPPPPPSPPPTGPFV
jgi:hypothetical protein